MLRCRIKLFYAATKLRYFSDFKLGVSIPVRGESSELLNVEGEKNDYDWWVMVSYLETSYYSFLIFCFSCKQKETFLTGLVSKFTSY